MKGKALMAALLTVSVVLSGCAGQSSGLATAASVENTAPQSGEAAPSEEKSQTLNRSDEFSDRDFEVGYDETAAAMIRLNGTAAACDSDAVKIDGSTVTITDEGTYILRGTLDDGRVVVDTDKSDKVQLVLDNVTIHSETSAPIYILQADKVFVTMAPDSENALTNGGSLTRTTSMP